MKIVRILLVLLLQIAPAPCQLRQNTLQVSPEGEANLILSIGSYYPLKDAVDYLNGEYGWKISYEDPHYPESEIADIAIPQWKKSHPSERGFYVPKWTEMRFRITKPSRRDGEQKRVLTEVVEQFNRLDRQDKFTILDASLNRNVVIGAVRGESVLEHASIGPEKEQRSGSEELHMLTEHCGTQLPMHMIAGTVSFNMLGHIILPPRRTSVSCREAILALTAQGGADLVYQIMEDITGQMFVVNIVPNRIVIRPQN
jgi:hypothetical protein